MSSATSATNYFDMKVTNAAELKMAIAELEEQCITREMDLLYGIKAYAQEMKDTMVNVSMGMGSGFVAKKLVSGDKSSLLKRLAGDVVQGIVTTVVTSKGSKIKALGSAILKNLFKK